MDIPAWREEKPAKNLVQNDRKLMWSLVRIGEREREKSLRAFEK